MADQVGRAPFVLGGIGFAAHALAAVLDEEKRNLAVELGRHDEGIGLVACRNNVFRSIYRIAIAGFRGFCSANINLVARLALL